MWNLFLDGGDCVGGICRKYVNTDTMTCQFKDLYIESTRREDIEASFKQREQNNVDPFGTGFGHKKERFDLNQIRLAFQVYLQSKELTGPAYRIEDVAVTKVIKDRKRFGDLKISDYSDNTSPFKGEYCNNNFYDVSIFHSATHF